MREYKRGSLEIKKIPSDTVKRTAVDKIFPSMDSRKYAHLSHGPFSKFLESL